MKVPIDLSAQSRGLLLAGGGVLLISPDSLLIRFLTIDFWTIMFLRGLFIALVLYLVMRRANSHSILDQIRGMDGNAWIMVVLVALSSFFFVAAIQTTSVAHALIIVGSVPVFAAILGWLMLGERVSLSTMLTILVVFSGLIFVVGDQGQSSVSGDLLALATCLAWAFNLVLARRGKNCNMGLVMMLSGCLMALGGLTGATFHGLDIHQAFIGAMLGVLNGLALFMLISAPRFIGAAEVAVFLPVETVLGSFLVWWFLGEYPGLVSVVAGLTIVVAIMLNSYYLARRASTPVGATTSE